MRGLQGFLYSSGSKIVRGEGGEHWEQSVQGYGLSASMHQAKGIQNDKK